MRFLLLFAFLFSANSFAGVYEQKDIWPLSKRIISVCIHNPREVNPINDAVVPTSFLISLAKDAVLNAYSHNTTIVEFTGFDECSNLSASDVVLIFNNKSFNGHANQYSDLTKKSQLTVTIGIGNKIESLTVEDTQRIESTLIHEFGHVAGLEHEHQYFIKDALKDPNCHLPTVSGQTVAQWLDATARFARSAGKNGALGLIGRVAPYYAAFKKDKKTIGSYDAYSIMNYCNNLNNSRAKLSNGDVETLRFMYRNH